MKRSLVYVIILSSVFVMGRSMSINNDIDDIEKEIKFIKLHQDKIDQEMQLIDAELAFLINPSNLENLNQNHFNLISQPLINIKNFDKKFSEDTKISVATDDLNKELN